MSSPSKTRKIDAIAKPKVTTPTKGEPKAPDESARDTFAQSVIRSETGSAITIKAYSGKCGDALKLMGLVNALSDQAKAVNDGDLKGAEVMLTTQAYALEAIFNELAQRAGRTEYLDNLDRYLRLALKAQSQCRTTLETLALIKNPKAVAFFRQANIAGQMQVNNGAQAAQGKSEFSDASTHAREDSGNEIPQNKLLEAKHGERMDIGATGAAGGTDKAMAAVGSLDGAKDRSGPATRGAKRIQGRGKTAAKTVPRRAQTAARAARKNSKQ